MKQTKEVALPLRKSKGHVSSVISTSYHLDKSCLWLCLNKIANFLSILVYCIAVNLPAISKLNLIAEINSAKFNQKQLNFSYHKNVWQ